MCLKVYIAIFVLYFPVLAYGHPGRTDRDGGHYNRSTGIYHFHGQQQTQTARNSGVNWLNVLDATVNLVGDIIESEEERKRIEEAKRLAYIKLYLKYGFLFLSLLAVIYWIVKKK